MLGVFSIMVLFSIEDIEKIKNGLRFPFVSVSRGCLGGDSLFGLPKELNGFVYSFDVYKNGDICLYLNKEVDV